MDIVPGLHSTLLIGVKFADADYVTILDREGIAIYYGKTTKITVSEKSVLSGYLTEEGLWRIPQKKYVQNINTYTLLIQCPSPKESISNVFELTSTEKTIKYYHAAAGFPTK